MATQTTTHHPVEHTVVIEALRAVVFNALTEAEALQRWFPTTAESDPRPGGRFKFVWEFAQAEHNGSQEGAYLEVVPPEKVRYPWQATPGSAATTTVTFTLAETGAGTEVHVHHTGWAAGEEGALLSATHRQLWTVFLGNLKTYLEEGIDNRAVRLGQKTV